MPRISLEILIEDKRWQHIPDLAARLKKAAAALYGQLPKSLQFSCKVTVLLTDDAAICRLNRDFRGMNRPTNVLSFPQFTPRQLTKKGKFKDGIYLGDIALGYQYIGVEAKKHRKILINHMVHLMIHGVLHLFGYDHKASAEATRMERLETRILADLGLPDPYAPQPKEPEAL